MSIQRGQSGFRCSCGGEVYVRQVQTAGVRILEAGQNYIVIDDRENIHNVASFIACESCCGEIDLPPDVEIRMT